MKRRLFLLAAPAIVAAPSLMRVSVAALTALPVNVGKVIHFSSINGDYVAGWYALEQYAAEEWVSGNYVRCLPARYSESCADGS